LIAKYKEYASKPGVTLPPKGGSTTGSSEPKEQAAAPKVVAVKELPPIPEDLLAKYKAYAAKPGAVVPPKGGSTAAFEPAPVEPAAKVVEEEPQFKRMPPPQDLVDKYRNYAANWK